jgi:eight-cysteine-cluster-containing protein
MKSSQILLYIILVLVLSTVAAALYSSYKQSSSLHQPRVTDFVSCAAAGYPVMESYPRQCASPDGRSFYEQVTLPINASSTVSTPTAADGCVIGGCSGEVCGEASDAGGIVSSCIYRAAYACYKTASCARQQNGKCGWTPTPALAACLAHPGNSSSNTNPVPTKIQVAI